MRAAGNSAGIAVGLALVLLSGCASRSGQGGESGAYVIPPLLDATRLLSPPPADAAAQSRDLAAVRAAQRERTASQVEHAEASSAVDVFLFAEVLGPRFTPERLPKTTEFFARVYRSSLPHLQATKECWWRPRPFVVDPTLVPLAGALASTRLRSAPAPVQANPQPPADSPCTAPVAETSYSPSYPSGHATVGAMMGILLAQMVPERRIELFAHGWKYGEARVVSGVHFPSDVEAGRILGTILVGAMQQDQGFRTDLEAARTELRAGLGYE